MIDELNIPKDLMAEIATRENVDAAFDYVVSHLESAKQREANRRHKERICAEVLAELADGCFKVKDFATMVVTDGAKVREVQAPRIPGRVGCHAVMSVVERYLHPMLIKNTAASIQGRGMHWLHHIVEADVKHLSEENELFYYQCDVRHFYDNIDQGRLMAILEGLIEDKRLLHILDGFVRLLPKGLSKGLRSSQCLANIFLDGVDHEMCERVMRYTAEDGEERPLYYRYCDDIVIIDTDKRRLWALRDELVRLLGSIGLEVKPSEAIRPMSEGLDYLGYVQFETHSLLRKRIKQTAARKLHHIKSRKRRRQVVASLKGMACHADCKHLFKRLTGERMKKFGELGIKYVPEDGKKRFEGKTVQLRQLVNLEIEVTDYELGVKTQNGERCLVAFRDPRDGRAYKFFTQSAEMIQALEKVAEIDELPFLATIAVEYFGENKSKYKFT